MNKQIRKVALGELILTALVAIRRRLGTRTYNTVRWNWRIKKMMRTDENYHRLPRMNLKKATNCSELDKFWIKERRTENLVILIILVKTKTLCVHKVPSLRRKDQEKFHTVNHPNIVRWMGWKIFLILRRLRAPKHVEPTQVCMLMLRVEKWTLRLLRCHRIKHSKVTSKKI